MVRKYYEISCDQCGCTSHYSIGTGWKWQAKQDGFIINKFGLFCNEECLNNFKKSGKAVTAKDNVR